MTGGARQLRALVLKDLLLEVRGGEVLPALVAFAAGTFVLVRFALGGDRVEGGVPAAVGLLWVAVAFTATLALLRAFAAEREHGLWDGLLAAPVDRATLWLGRTLSLAILLALTEAVALPLFWLFFLQDGDSPSLVALAAALALADVGIAAVGSLVAGLAAHTRAPEALLPVLFVPFSVPLVLVGADLTIDTISPQTGTFEVLRGLGFLGLYDTIFALLGWALFEYVVEE